MALDPARFLQADCAIGLGVQGAATFAQSLFQTISTGNPSDLISGGLKALSQVSDAIRIGAPQSQYYNTPGFTSLYSKIQSVTNDAQGAGIVLDTVGIGASAIAKVAQFNPSVAASGQSQAVNVFQQVKGGTFSQGAAQVAQTGLSALAALNGQIYTPDGPSISAVAKCGPSPYAMDLIGRAPKMKFMFVVQFIFNAPYSSMFNSYGQGTAFVVKQSSRPSVEFEYEEVNMYNYRTQVPKRTIYQPMTMVFYDDNTNNVTNFYNAYLKAYSPIANMGGSISNGTVSVNSPSSELYANDSFPHTVTDQYLKNGDKLISQLSSDNVVFRNALATGKTGPYTREQIYAALDLNQRSQQEWQQKRQQLIANDQAAALQYSASLGALQNNNVTMLQSVLLYHVFDQSMTVYSFSNPKITRLVPDDLVMADSGNGSEMSFEFVYDGLYVIPEYQLASSSPFNITELTSGGLYPISPPQNLGSVISNIAGEVESGVSKLFGSSNPIANPNVAANVQLQNVSVNTDNIPLPSI